MTGFPLSRRRLLQALAAASLAPAAARAAAKRRFAVVDWALLETAIALGLVPLAAPELILFRRLAVEPEIPAGVADLGLRGALSFERLALLRPDIVYGSNYSAWAAPQIEPIAPLKTFELFVPGEPPLEKIEAMTFALASDFDIPDKGKAVIDSARATIADLRQSLRTDGGRKVLLVDVGDANHVRVYGGDSLFGETLVRLGLTNAWQGGTRYSATAPVGMETLAAYPDAFLIVVDPVPPAAAATIRTGALWQALPSVAAGRFAVIEPCDAFGALPASLRLARLVTAAVTHRPAPRPA
ncbi:iron-siderophore ABC transporter substrate-binding protein [Jiella endophytica]|uniref:Iron-siderophore ABC transporter substrate-binding protein n=1 Tax=Jiella endophytica TaxID=2558362 RepID=A0A4Y8RQC0_9HYPH|nr:ABC transporter substrate-binding protein [Jiella endophytica]TFF24984.1 iron-siderophore ABC transporter substrate-binding protein [Jiella endophytica]